MKAIITLVFVMLLACAPITQMQKQGFDANKQIAFGRDKGNCLACHAIEDGEAPENTAQH